MNGFSLVCYIEHFNSSDKEELSSLYYRLSDYCLEHLLKYELIILTPSPLDVSEITMYFKEINIKNNIRVYKCNEKFSKVSEFTITVGTYETMIILDYSKYTRETVGVELMFTDFLKYETPCCIGLFKDNNSDYSSLIGVAMRYNGIVSHFKLYEITIPFKLSEKIRRYRFIYSVKDEFLRCERLERLKYTSKGRKKYVNVR